MPESDRPPVYTLDRQEIDLARRELRVGGVPVPLGDRAFDIIQVLVQSDGELVTKDVLMARVWPGVAVEENTLHVHMSAIRKALGADGSRLKTVFGRGYRLLGRWTAGLANARARALDPSPLVQSKSALTNLPAMTSDLIGRTALVRHVQQLLSAYRMVTLTGPGGIGKTVLALKVAHMMRTGFAGNVWFVELASLSDPGLVPSAVANVFGLELGEDAISADAVARAISGERFILVLDNCEHVIDAAASLAESILRHSRQACILATTREGLRVEGEHIYQVPPLDVPDADQRNPDAVLEYSAVRLFLDRVRASTASLSLDEENLGAVASICRHLDGIPLAIELAAARAATLGVQQVAFRLHDRFSILTNGRRTALPKHRTLRATLDWSYELLPDHERAVLQRLAIFAGSFSLQAAGAVTSDDAIATTDCIESIANLVARSLVSLDPSRGTTHYRLLETTRAYALDKLVKSGDLQHYARRHATYYRDLFQDAESTWDRLTPDEVRFGLGRHIDNVRAALDWAFGAGQAPGIGIALTVAAAPLWIALFLVEECRVLVDRALSALANQPDADLAHEMRLIATIGVVTQHTDGVGPGLDVPWGKVLALARQLGDLDYQLRALRGLTNGAMTRNYREALEFARQYRNVAATSSDATDVLIGDRMIGFVLHHLGEHEESRRLTEGMLAHLAYPPDRRRLVEGTPGPHAVAKIVLARITWLQGFADQAMQIAIENVQEADALDHPVSLFCASAYAAYPLALLTGDVQGVAVAGNVLHSVIGKHRPYGSWRDGFAALEVIRRGDAVTGLEMLSRATRTMRDDAFGAYFGMFLAGRVEGLMGVGMLDDARAAADAALAHCRAANEYWYVPELLRLRGEVRLRMADPARVADAERDFQAGLDLARRQTALAWDLRIAISFAQLRREQGQIAAAREMLLPVFVRFTEGLETTDVLAAKQLLAGLT